MTTTTGSEFSSSQIQNRLLGKVFGAFVDTHKVGFVGRRRLVGRRAVANLAECGHGTAMDDTLGASVRCDADHRQRAVDVGSQHRLRVRHPDPVVGRDVNNVSATGGRATQRIGLGEVAVHDLSLQTGQISSVT